MPLSLGEDLANKGWRTGAVLPNDMILSIGPHLTRPGGVAETIDPEHWLVIVSQTCDVLAKKIESEPLVEILHCKPISKLRQDYKELRSTRILDFKPNRESHEGIVLTAHAIKDRYIVPREILQNYDPDSARRLSTIATTRILNWYALRYARPAWPDSFVKRISHAKKELEAILLPIKDDVAELRISIVVKNSELQENEPYHIAIYFVVDESIWNEDVEARAVIHSAFAAFASKINSCTGVAVIEELSNVFSGANFSWQATKNSDEWNFANLTHRD